MRQKQFSTRQLWGEGPWKLQRFTSRATSGCISWRAYLTDHGVRIVCVCACHARQRTTARGGQTWRQSREGVFQQSSWMWCLAAGVNNMQCSVIVGGTVAYEEKVWSSSTRANQFFLDWSEGNPWEVEVGNNKPSQQSLWYGSGRTAIAERTVQGQAQTQTSHLKVHSRNLRIVNQYTYGHMFMQHGYWIGSILPADRRGWEVTTEVLQKLDNEAAIEELERWES